MDLTKYGKIITTKCTECLDEAIQRAWDEGPPEWLFKFEDGDFGMRAGPECTAWEKDNFLLQACFVAEYDNNELLTLCAKHLSRIAALVAEEQRKLQPLVCINCGSTENVNPVTFDCRNCYETGNQSGQWRVWSK